MLSRYCLHSPHVNAVSSLHPKQVQFDPIIVGDTEEKIHAEEIAAIRYSNFPVRREVLRAFQFALRFAEDLELFESPFSVVYCRPSAGRDGECAVDPTLEELQQLAYVIPTKYWRNVYCLWVIHPTAEMERAVQVPLNTPGKWCTTAGFRIREKIRFAESAVAVSREMQRVLA